MVTRTHRENDSKENQVMPDGPLSRIVITVAKQLTLPAIKGLAALALQRSQPLALKRHLGHPRGDPSPPFRGDDAGRLAAGFLGVPDAGAGFDGATPAFPGADFRFAAGAARATTAAASAGGFGLAATGLATAGGAAARGAGATGGATAASFVGRGGLTLTAAASEASFGLGCGLSFGGATATATGLGCAARGTSPGDADCDLIFLIARALCSEARKGSQFQPYKTSWFTNHEQNK